MVRRGERTKLTLRRKTPLGDEIVDYADVYCTDLFAEIAEEFIGHASDPAYNPEAKPWALLVWPNAPNVQTPPNRYIDAPLPSWKRPPSFLERDMSDKPAEILHSPKVRNSIEFHRATGARQLRSLMAVDDLVERVFAKVAETGMSESTWGIFTSDNGRFWGEHRLFGKLYGYEEGVAVPLRMRVPGMGDGALRSFAGNIDVAPTLLDIAGAEATADFDGRSLLPLLEGKTWNRAMLAENWTLARYDALRTKRWRYVLWPRTRSRELYDRTRDPWELRNIASEREAVVQRLHQTLSNRKKA